MVFDFPITRSSLKGRKLLRRKLLENIIQSNCKHLLFPTAKQFECKNTFDSRRFVTYQACFLNSCICRSLSYFFSCSVIFNFILFIYLIIFSFVFLCFQLSIPRNVMSWKMILFRIFGFFRWSRIHVI